MPIEVMSPDVRDYYAAIAKAPTLWRTIYYSLPLSVQQEIDEYEMGVPAEQQFCTGDLNNER